jgi:2-dehydropantoate 2-reductase
MSHAGAPVKFIARKAFVDAVDANGLVLDSKGVRERVRVETATDMSAVRGASFVLLSVKTTDTVSAAKELDQFLDPAATVVCLQNGVDNVERIREATKISAVPAAVYIAVSVPEPGQVKHLARGDLVIGPPSEQTEYLQNIFTRAGIPCRITENIEGELWIKMLCNCALNAISALGNARYGQIAENSDGWQLMGRVVEEVLAVARAAHVELPNIVDTDAGMAATMQIATQMTGAFSSTAQDLQRGRLTEIDSLNGYIARRGAELGVNVPINHALFTLVKLAEQNLAP